MNDQEQPRTDEEARQAIIESLKTEISLLNRLISTTDALNDGRPNEIPIDGGFERLMKHYTTKFLEAFESNDLPGVMHWGPMYRDLWNQNPHPERAATLKEYNDRTTKAINELRAVSQLPPIA